MEYKVLFGSKMLKLDRPHDEDWVTYIERKQQYLETECQNIAFQNKKIRHFIEGKSVPSDLERAIYIYQRSVGFHEEEEYLFKWFNIFEHQTVWINQLKNYINLDCVEKEATEKDILPKHFYHFLYQYYMIQEQQHWISGEAKQQVQAIHDQIVPSSYFYELRNLINSL